MPCQNRQSFAYPLQLIGVSFLYWLPRVLPLASERSRRLPTIVTCQWTQVRSTGSLGVSSHASSLVSVLLLQFYPHQLLILINGMHL